MSYQRDDLLLNEGGERDEAEVERKVELDPNVSTSAQASFQFAGRGYIRAGVRRRRGGRGRRSAGRASWLRRRGGRQ